MPTRAPLEIFYDGQCPLCRREMRWAQSIDRGGKLIFIDFSARDFVSIGIDPETMTRTIHAREGDTIYVGVEVFRQIYARFGLGPLMAVTRLRPFSTTLDSIYARYCTWRMKHRGGHCDDSSCTPKSLDRR